MNDQRQALPSETMVDAIETNVAEAMLALGRAGNGEERDEPTIHWTIGGSPINYHNCVVRANLAPETADQAILASVAACQRHGVPGSWHVGPAMRPLDLGQRLARHGFRSDGNEPGMALDLAAMPASAPAPRGLTIERVGEAQALEQWVQTLAVDFGEGEYEARWVGEMVRRVGLHEDAPWQLYLGRLHGEPVATTALYLGSNAAGIYFVATVPQARRQGIGGAITLAALQNASERGYRIAVLTASELGFSVYQRLGFQPYCQFAIYVWQPL
jgi:GNAT superfamily N-acetyltransferase